MKGLAKALWITGSLLAIGLTGRSQVLRSDFSMMEKRGNGDVLVKGRIAYLESNRSLQWIIAYPNTQTLAMPANAKKPNAEEEATIALFARFLQPDGFLESGLENQQGWEKIVDRMGASVYFPTKNSDVKASLRFVDGRLTRTTIEIPDGRTVTYLFSDYQKINQLGLVPQRITTVLASKGKKSYKRLVLRNLAYEP